MKLEMLDPLKAIADWEDADDIANAVAEAQYNADLVVVDKLVADLQASQERVRELGEALRERALRLHVRFHGEACGFATCGIVDCIEAMSLLEGKP